MRPCAIRRCIFVYYTVAQLREMMERQNDAAIEDVWNIFTGGAVAMVLFLFVVVST